MKKDFSQYAQIVMTLTVVVLAAAGMLSPARGEITVFSGARLNLFRDDLASRTEGAELTMPIGVIYQDDPLSFRLETSYSRANISRKQGAETTLGSFTDTLLAVSYQVTQRPFPVMAGLHVNLPTGMEQLSETEQELLLGKDYNLLNVYNFGEGLNIGGALSTVYKFGNVTMGVSGSFTSKGKYTPSTARPDEKFNPGDLVMGTARVAWQAFPRFNVGASATYSYFFTDRLNGEKTGQLGDILVLGGRIAAAPTGSVGVTVGWKYVLPDKSKRLIDETLQTEPQNSKRKILSTETTIVYASSPTLALKLTGDIRYYFESERTIPDTGLPYAGKRVRYNVGPGVSYALKSNLSCQAVATYLILHEDADIERSVHKTTTGVNVDFGIRYTF